MTSARLLRVKSRGLSLEQRCRIHAEKMEGEGWYTTANVLWEAAEVLKPVPAENLWRRLKRWANGVHA